MVVMAAFRAMHMGRWFLSRRGQLSRKHNSSGFVLLGQMFCNLGVEGFDIADHTEEKPPGLEILAGKLRQKCQCAVQNFGSRACVGDLLGLLLHKGVIFLLEAFGKDRHRSGRYMERA